jgi:hypothetical protein
MIRGKANSHSASHKIFLFFVELQDSLQYSQQTTNDSYPQPD